MGLKFFRNDVMNSVHEKQKRLDGREVCKAIHQRLGTLVTDFIDTEVQLLDGCQQGQVGPQRLGTLVTNLIGDEVKLLDGREEG